MIIRDMVATDLLRVRLDREPPQPHWRYQGTAMLRAGPCWAAVHDGEVLAVAGLVLHWAGRAGCWCLIGSDFPARLWPALHAAVRIRLARAAEQLGLHRIEAETLSGFANGTRWMRLLGFAPEGLARAFGPDRADHHRWAKVLSDG